MVDVTKLKSTERDLRAVRESVPDELRRMTRLHELSAELMAPGGVQASLGNVLRAAVEITAADFGNIQGCDEAGELTIAAQTGFDDPFLTFFARVNADTDRACGAAMTTRRRVLVGDVTTSPIFEGQPSLPALTAAGVRAVQSTPLFDRAGHFLGIFSTHYRDVHHFEEAELRWLDLLARHAADVIERGRAEQLLAESRRELETRVADRTRWLLLMHEVTRAINEAATWDDALHQVLRRLCTTEHWQIGFVYLPQPATPATIAPVVSCFEDERFRAFHDVSMKQTFAREDRLPGRVYAATNQPFWAYRIAQEAVTNSVRHAQANTITIRIVGISGLVRLEGRRRWGRYSAPGTGRGDGAADHAPPGRVDRGHLEHRTKQDGRNCRHVHASGGTRFKQEGGVNADARRQMWPSLPAVFTARHDGARFRMRARYAAGVTPKRFLNWR